jgi:hypothetical protein
MVELKNFYLKNSIKNILFYMASSVAAFSSESKINIGVYNNYITNFDKKNIDSIEIFDKDTKPIVENITYIINPKVSFIRTFIHSIIVSLCVFILKVITTLFVAATINQINILNKKKIDNKLIIILSIILAVTLVYNFSIDIYYIFIQDNTFILRLFIISLALIQYLYILHITHNNLFFITYVISSMAYIFFLYLTALIMEDIFSIPFFVAYNIIAISISVIELLFNVFQKFIKVYEDIQSKLSSKENKSKGIILNNIQKLLNATDIPEISDLINYQENNTKNIQEFFSKLFNDITKLIKTTKLLDSIKKITNITITNITVLLIINVLLIIKCYEDFKNIICSKELKK